MKRLLVLLTTALVAGLLVTGCSDDTPLAPQGADLEDGSIYQRPEFIDTRPPEVQLQYTLTAEHAQPVKPDVTAEKGLKYALVIGISDYAGTVNDLNYCDDDAVDWAARLQAEGYGVTTLIDGQATQSAITAQVDLLVARSIAGNEIAFTYSGHGSRGNIISADLYYISSSWFGTKFAACASAKMAFAFDACQIGAMGTALNRAGRVIALASDTKRYSYDGDATMQNGVFTYYQMQGFDSMGFIFYEPDCAYAVQKMKEWASLHRVKVAPYYIDAYAGDLDL